MQASSRKRGDTVVTLEAGRERRATSGGPSAARAAGRDASSRGSRSGLSLFLLRSQKRPVELRGARMMGASGGLRMGVVSDVVSSASLSISSKLSLTEGMICTTFSWKCTCLRGAGGATGCAGATRVGVQSLLPLRMLFMWPSSERCCSLWAPSKV